MRKKLFTKLLATALCAGILAGCAEQPAATNPAPTPSGGQQADNSASTGQEAASTDGSSDERYQTSGKVVVAVNSGIGPDYRQLIEKFPTYYPNIELEVVEYETSTSEYLTAQASTGQMPDVILDDADTFYYYVSQGWVYPLTEFVKDDEEFTYIPENIIESYTYLDELYAVPEEVHFNCVFLNLDLLETLNLDVPELNWSTDDYKDLLKAGTTAQYSGTETLFSMDEYLAGSMSDYGFYGFDPSTRTFHMSESWVDAVNVMIELRAYPGLEAWSLRNTSPDIESSDYVAKFGNGETGDTHMALKLGKTLSEPRGTWDISWLTTDCNFNWCMWPWPSNGAGKGKAKLPMHVNCSFVVSTAQNPQAAFEVVRFMSYSKEGNLERVAVYEQGSTDDYTLGSPYYIPSTNLPAVKERWEALSGVTEAVAYMHDSMGSSFRADLSKIIPGWSQVNSEYLSPRGDEVRDGATDAASVAAELDTVATKSVQTYWDDFTEKLTAVQEAFNNSDH
ncbi:MAG: extracellular solute-binding protein [Lachnospiraceae bacterium]|nr:extracellular solute-binding protein [Lachnospiraceae bacterium]